MLPLFRMDRGNCRLPETIAAEIRGRGEWKTEPSGLRFRKLMPEDRLALAGGFESGPPPQRGLSTAIAELIAVIGMLAEAIKARSPVVIDAERRAASARSGTISGGGFNRSETVRASSAAGVRSGLSRTLLANAEARRVRAAQSADPTTRSDGDGADDRPTDAAREATTAYVEWLVKSREALRAWNDSPPPRGNAPVNDFDLRKRQRQAVLDGADAHIVEALTLTEPKGLVALQAESRLIATVMKSIR